MAVKAHHALSRADYEAEGANAVLVTHGDLWGRFDRYGGWIEGELRQADPQLCIWLTGLYVIQERADATAKA